MKFWFSDDYYCTIQPGQFGYGWELFDENDRIIAMSGALCRSKQAARDEAKAAIPVCAT